MNTSDHAAGSQGVVLDIGHDAGAVVLTAAPAAVGTEVYLIDETGRDRHAEVHERVDGRGRIMFAVVFDNVPPGRYTIEGASARSILEVKAGWITEGTLD